MTTRASPAPPSRHPDPDPPRPALAAERTDPNRDGPAPHPSLPPPPEGRRALEPGGAVVVALATAAGALAARPLSLLVPLAVLGAVVALRRPVLLAVPALLAASALGDRAEAGLAPPDRGAVAGTATLVSDPEARWGTVEAVARLDGRHVLLEADGAAADIVAARLAGERLVVTGRVGPLPPEAAWLRVRHVAAVVAVREARAGPEAAPPWRAANHLRRLLAAGAEPLGDDGRALYLGLVLGDDRDQPPEVVDDFRGSGLAHLLAVSGQNVAFVLALAGPVLRRLGLGGRVAAVGALLALFAVATRGEPSVLRAVAMAAGSTLAAARGRPTPGIQVLALAVAALLLVDPLLVRATGFHLSVAATAGILVLGPRLAAVLPGPEPVVAAVAVSASAQLAVAPLLVAGFGGVPVAALPANLLAAPAAAVVMTWGLPAGVVAGLLGPPCDRWLHLPTALALRGLAAVARAAASAPLGELGAVHVVALALALAVVVAAARTRPPRAAVLRGGAGLVAVVALAAPGWALHHPPTRVEPEPGVEVWRAGGATVVVVAPGSGPTATLEGLRRAGVVAVDLLVVGPGGTALDEVAAARHRAPVRRVWVLGRDPPGPAAAVRLGGLEVHVDGSAACVGLGGRDPCRPPEPGR